MFWLYRVDDPECSLSFETNGSILRMNGDFKDGISFMVEATLRTKGGSVDVIDKNRLKVSNADEILVLINIGTSAKNELPSALPPAWPDGKIRGLRARGGYTVTVKWKNSRLLKAEVNPLKDRVCTIKHDGDVFKVLDEDGGVVDYHRDDTYIWFEVKGGKSYTIAPLETY